MAKNENKRQKQLAKKKRKDKDRKKARATATPADLRRLEKMLEDARSYPVYECLVNDGWQEKGLAAVLLARTQPNGLLLVGSYLVDIWCLGLKSTFAHFDMTTSDYRKEFVSQAGGGDPMVKCPLDLAHQIVYGGIDYAAQFGFEPDPDFEFSEPVLEERGALPPCEVTFGKDGKPLFVAGPRDDTEAVLRQLEKTIGLGEGKAHFIAPIGLQPDFEDLDEDDGDEGEDWDEEEVETVLEDEDDGKDEENK
jgi:hypothetical protein